MNINTLNNKYRDFIKLNVDKGFTQFISQPTRCTESSESFIGHIFLQ